MMKIPQTTIEMTFRLMNIEDEKTLQSLLKMTDEEIIEELKNEKYSSL